MQEKDDESRPHNSVRAAGGLKKLIKIWKRDQKTKIVDWHDARGAQSPKIPRPDIEAFPFGAARMGVSQNEARENEEEGHTRVAATGKILEESAQRQGLTPRADDNVKGDNCDCSEET